MAFSPETYALCLKNTAEKIDEALTSVYNYKGSVDTIADLPLTNNKVGDTYDVKSEGGQNYGWNGESWDSLGVNREATDTDLGLIKKKDNTFNTTTFVGDMTAINSNNTSITGSGITSVNGEGNFEVSKPTTILASKTNNIAGEVVNITPSSSMNVTAESINLTALGSNGPITLTGDVTISNGFGYGTTHINSNIITKNLKGDAIDATSLTIARKANILEDLSAKSVYALNIGFKDKKNFLYASGTAGVMILGENNDLCYPNRQSQVTKSIIIGDNNDINNDATNIFVIGQTNYIDGLNSIVAGTDNYTYDNYCLVSGTYNNAYALGQTIFGSHHNSTSASYNMRNAEYSLISGVSNFANGKAASVLGDNLLGSRETGSLTIGTFNSSSSGNLFVIGNGYQNESGTIFRQNALTIDKDGVIESPYIKISEDSIFLKQSSSSASTELIMGERNDIIINRQSNSLKIGSSNVSTGGIYIGTAPGENSHSNQLTKGCINIESKDTINLIAGYNGAERLVVGGGFKILSSNIGTFSIPNINISRDMHVSGYNLNEMCKLNFGVNGFYLGSKSDWTNNKLPSSKGNIFYIGDELNYTSGSDNDTQYNYNGILVIGNCNNKATPTKDNLFIVGNGYQAGDTTNGSNALRLTSDGTLYYKTGMGEGADYAEFFEWSDGNLLNEDRCGLFVTFDFNKEYKYANSQELPHIKPANEGDYILGVISGNPSFVGNSDEEWKKRWLYDDFDRPIMETIQVPITKLQEVETGEYRTEIEYDENDNEIEVKIPITETKEIETGEYRTEIVQVQNPDYNPSETYVNRKNRKEWETTGMLGVLSVRDDGTCQVGKFCKCGQNGVATLAEERGIDTFLVLKRVNDNIIKIIFK